MVGMRLGPTKRKKASKSVTKPSKKAKVASESTQERNTTSKPKLPKVRNKGINRISVDLVHNEEREITEQDIQNFEEYAQFQGFLHSLDPSALAKKNVHKTKSDGYNEDVKQAAFPARHQITSDRVITSRPEGDEIDPSSIRVTLDHQEKRSTGTKNVMEGVDYEARARKFSKETDHYTDKLPIKLGDGRVKHADSQPAPKPVPQTKANDMSTTSDEDIISLKQPAEPPLLLNLIQTQELLAKLATEIIEDPVDNIDKLGKLREIQDSDDLSVQQYAILAQSAVYMDIIPGYRIRPLTDVEKAEKTTKEVRQLRTYEQALIHHYHEYVRKLELSVKRPQKSYDAPGFTGLNDVAITAACSLLTHVPHFNFRLELFAILIGQITRRTDDKIFVQCRTAIEHVFREDLSGESSVEALRLLCKKLKERDYMVHGSTIDTFLQLRLLTEMETRGSTSRVDRDRVKKKKERQFRTKKLKKLIKDQKEVEKDLQEAEAVVNDETRSALQDEALKLVFTTYFRILKSGAQATIGAALEGLAKFSHLVNVDFFGDLLEVLKELMSESKESPSSLSTRDNLLCIVTAFSLLSGQGATKETLSLDLSRFMDKLYECLLLLAFNPEIEVSEVSTRSERAEDTEEGSVMITHRAKVNVSTETEMLLRALDAVLFKQKVHGNSRLIAFVKRLTISSLHFPEKSAAVSLDLTKRLVARHAKMATLFQNEERAGDGVYDGITDKIELCNPTTTSVWELAILQQHFSPRVRSSVKALTDLLNESGSNK